MEGIQMEPVGKYKTDRNGSAKAAAWRNMVDQDLDDVAFLADSDKAREARDLRNGPVAVCSQRRALCLAALFLGTLFAIALLVVYAAPSADCPCMDGNALIPGQPPTDAESTAAAANKERIATNGMAFPWRGARLPTFVTPKHYSLWLHPNLTTGELRGEVSIDFKVDRDTLFLVLNVRDMNVTERALFKSGGTAGPKIAKTLDYPPAEQTYIEFKDKLRRKYNYTLSLRFITKLDRSDKQRGFFLAGSHRHRCAVSRFWLTNARSAFPCLDEPHFRASFKLTIVRDRFHVSLTNMPIVATEEAGFYLGHRLLQDEFAHTPPMAPHMMSLAVCRLQRRAAPPLATAGPPLPPPDRPPTRVTTSAPKTTAPTKGMTSESTPIDAEEDEVLPPPEISMYSEHQYILDEAGPLLEWVQNTIQQFAFELNTSYPLPKLDIVAIDGISPYSEGWGLVIIPPATLTDTKTIARLLAQQWFGGLVSPRWWSAQWLLEALTSVLGERAPPLGGQQTGDRRDDALLLDHVLPALRLDSSNSVRAVASPRLERADIEAATDELSLHKGAAIVSMAIEAAGEEAGRAALARLLRDHRCASADARDLWRALQRPGQGAPAHAWDGWCERPGYPLLTALPNGPHVVLKQERFVMAAEPPEPQPPLVNELLTLELRADLEELFYEPEANITEVVDEDLNATTTTPAPTTTTRRPQLKTTKPPPPPKWIIPVTFIVGPLEQEYDDEQQNLTKTYKNTVEHLHQNGTWYDVGNETRYQNVSRWAENVTHLVWMNDTEMTIPDLGKHKWVRYNVGARGLYRVAPQDPVNGEWTEASLARAAAPYSIGAPAERALSLDDAFVLSRAGRLPARRAVAAAARLNKERHWAPWRVVLKHLSWWRELLQLTAAGPPFQQLLKSLHPRGAVKLYTQQQIYDETKQEDLIWLSGALLTAGVEWENEAVTQQAVALFDGWIDSNQTIPEIYQEAAFTGGVRRYGERAWLACWRALVASYAAPRPNLSHRALLHALAAPKDDWLFYRFAWTALSTEAQRSREWRAWATALCSGACRWRGSGGAWRVLRANVSALPPAALNACARCLHQPQDYYNFKGLFGSSRGAHVALDTIALNAAWVSKAEADLVTYFSVVHSH